mmetsp:Transcript_38438/g.46363  ORF Transcript_38438/g.46363 Transcript_38438/m.46363 type:complete len:403 (-) Transcript_38438:655-1863(-)
MYLSYWTNPRRQHRGVLDDSKSQCFCLLLFICGTGALVGGYLILKAPKAGVARSSLVGHWNDGIQVWNEGAYDVFSQASFTAEIKDHHRVSLSPTDEESMSYEMEVRADVDEYTPLVYAAPVTTKYDFDGNKHPLDILEYPGPETMREELPEMMTVTITGSKIKNGTEQVVKVEEFPLWTTHSYPTRSTDCYQRGGTYNKMSRYCTLLMEPHEICITVDKDEITGDWKQVSPYGGMDCWPGMLQRGNVLNDIVRYKPVGRHLGVAPTIHVPEEAIKVVVRSAADPYLLALNLTEGSLYFGPSEAERVLEGLVLLIVCLGLTIPACCHLSHKYLEERIAERRWASYQIGEFDDGITPGYGFEDEESPTKRNVIQFSERGDESPRVANPMHGVKRGNLVDNAGL